MAEKENKETSEELDEVTVSEDTDNAGTAENAVVASKESKPAKKTKDAQGKPGFFSRIGTSLKKFWKMMKSELKKVTWYSRKQTFNSTLLVIVCMVSAGVVLGVLDFGFSWVLEWFAGLF